MVADNARATSAGVFRGLTVGVLNGLSSVLPQVAGVVFLSSFGYGQFSIVYLAFAFGSSIVLSVVGDAWVVSNRGALKADIGIYFTLLTSASLIFGVIAAIVTLAFVRDVSLITLGSFAVLFATFRVGFRYLLMQRGRWVGVSRSDAVFLISFTLLLSLGVFRSAVTPNSLLLIWSLSSILSIFSNIGMCRFSSLRLAWQWLGANRRSIRPLLLDTLVMDASVVGTPYGMAPLLGMSAFGAYRAVSSLSSPLRLLVAPLRPGIVGAPSVWLKRTKVLLVYSGGAVIAVSSVVVLLAVGQLDVSVGVISDLAPYSIPVGVYVLAAALLAVYPLVCRASLSQSRLLVGRIGQTFLGVIGPFAGLVVGGLEGAIWGFALASLLAGVAWHALAHVSRVRTP